MLGWVLYLTILITGSLMEADIGSCSLYCGIFRFLMIVEKKLFKTLAVSLSFFIILVLSTSVNLFPGHNFVRKQWFNYFPKSFTITYIFYTQILIIFSFTFFQMWNIQVILFVIIDFILPHSYF